ncbi:MAG: acyl-CoA dehydrogenase family protein [bacterium]
MSLNFGFSDSEQLYQDQIRRFAKSELAPMRQQWDKECERPQAMVQKALEAGLLDTEMSHVMRGIMMEAVGYADFNCALPFLVTTEPFELNRLDGVPDDVRNPVRQAVREGKTIIGVGFTEPSSGTDVANFKSTAVLDGDEWVINAVKNSISWADAEYFTVTCRTEGDDTGIWSLSNFFVPKATEGVQAPRMWKDMGTHGAERGEVRFENVRVPKNYLVGERGKAYLQMAQLFDTNRAYIGLKCIGAAQASVNETCEFAKQRVVMGNAISNYQGISFPLVEAETQLEAARLLCYKTLWLRDQELPHSKEGGMCKWWVPELTFEIVRQCLTIHGHYGYSDELPFDQRLRDILGWQIGDGTSQVSKLIVARAMFGKQNAG